MRKIVEFRVPVGTGEDQQWLTESGALTSAEDESVVFSIHDSPTPEEQIRIEMLEHRVLGGIDAYFDLHEGVERARAALLRELEAKVWPDGRPEASTADEAQVQQESLLAAQQGHSSRILTGFLAMQDLARRVRFQAAWEILIVDPPHGWSSVRTREITPAMFGWIEAAYLAARAETEAGKR